jgi:MFS family permease
MKKDMQILLYSNYLNTFGYSLFGPLYSLFVLKVGGSAFTAGATWSAYMLAAGLFIFLFGKFGDVFYSHRKGMIIAGYFVLAFGALAFVMVTNTFDIYLVQIFNALGVGLLTPIWKASYARTEYKGKEAEGWALFDGADYILIAIAAFLGGVYVTYFSFTNLFIAIFVIQIIAAFVSVKLLD